MTSLSRLTADALVSSAEVADVLGAVESRRVSQEEVAEFSALNWDLFERDAKMRMASFLRDAGRSVPSMGALDLRRQPELEPIFSGEVVLAVDRVSVHPGVIPIQRALQILAHRTREPRLVPGKGADGRFGEDTQRAVQHFQRAFMGLSEVQADGVFGRRTLAALDRALYGGAATPSMLVLPFEPNPEAMRRARATPVGQRFVERTPVLRDLYLRTEQLTHVPWQFIAALHANESGQGLLRALTRGPESGFGLDPRTVTTAWANGRLRAHGLGAWQRGGHSDTSTLQSAVVAAEHLKNMANVLSIEIRGSMSSPEIAGLITGYVNGVSAGNRAKRAGKSWMFDPTDPNPHPEHPGGTSIAADGTTIAVPPGRKDGLLRWDVLLPLAHEALV